MRRLKKSKSGERGIWTPEDLNLLHQDIKATLPVDDRRIYLSGISMGGYDTWPWAAHDPQYFAAIAPIVGGIGREEPKDVTPDFDQWATNLATIPVYAFVGAMDKTVPPERSERMIAAIHKRPAARRQNSGFIRTRATVSAELSSPRRNA